MWSRHVFRRHTKTNLFSPLSMRLWNAQMRAMPRKHHEGQVCQVVTNPDVVSVIKYQGQNEYGTMADLIMW